MVEKKKKKTRGHVTGSIRSLPRCSRGPPRCPHTRSSCAPNFVQDNTMPTDPARFKFFLVTHTRKSQRNRNGTHDHDIERQEDPTLRPVRLGVRRDVVDEEARADEENDLEQI